MRKKENRFRRLFLGLSLLLGSARPMEPAVAEESFDPQPWHQVLSAVVNGEGFVDYETLRKNPENLNRFLAQAEKISPNSHPQIFSTKEDQLVYWLQVYNALAMKNILMNPGLKKTSDKKLRFFVFTKFTVGGESYSLYSLENKVIREKYQDPRVHFFLNCASYSCPSLSREPLRASQLEEQLDRFSSKFLNDPKHVRFDSKNGTLSLSMILKWYEKDFLKAMTASGAKNDPAKLVGFINKYRDPSQQIPQDQVKKISYLPYNWTVNDQKNM